MHTDTMSTHVDSLRTAGFHNFKELRNTSSSSTLYVCKRDATDARALVKFSDRAQLVHDWAIRTWLGEREGRREEEEDDDATCHLVLATECSLQRDVGYNVYAYHENGSLLSYIKQNVLTAQHLLDICIGVSRGLAVLHGIDVVHCDVHVNNVIVDARGRAMLSDFGSVQRLPHTNAHVHTHTECMSPQSVVKQKPDLYTDVWQLGHLFYCILTSGTDRYLFGRDLSTANRYIVMQEHCARYEADVHMASTRSALDRLITGTPDPLILEERGRPPHECSGVQRAYYQLAHVKPPHVRSKLWTQVKMTSLVHGSLAGAIGAQIADKPSLKRFLDLTAECLGFVDFLRPTVGGVLAKLEAVKTMQSRR